MKGARTIDRSPEALPAALASRGRQHPISVVQRKRLLRAISNLRANARGEVAGRKERCANVYSAALLLIDFEHRYKSQCSPARVYITRTRYLMGSGDLKICVNNTQRCEPSCSFCFEHC